MNEDRIELLLIKTLLCNPFATRRISIWGNYNNMFGNLKFMLQKEYENGGV